MHINVYQVLRLSKCQTLSPLIKKPVDSSAKPARLRHLYAKPKGDDAATAERHEAADLNQW